MYLRCFTSGQLKEWCKWLPWAEYNTSYHSTIKMTPYEAVFGRPPFSILSYIPGTPLQPAVDLGLRNRDVLSQELKKNMLAAQHRTKQQADTHRTERAVNEGGLVYRKIHPFCQTSLNLPKHANHSLRGPS